MNSLLDFSKKVVLVTGGGTGIGRAVSIAFAKQGAKVVIGDICADAEETIRLITSAGGEGFCLKTDVSNAKEVEALVQKTVDVYGRLDCAFNNAGILPPTRLLAEQGESDFDRTIAVDLKGVFLCLKYQIQHMIRAGGGAIVNTASIAGLIADPAMAPYVAAKHGVIGLTKAAAVDYAKHCVRVNALAPGLVHTPMTQRWIDDPLLSKEVVAGPLLGRPATPEEMVGIVLYLCSPLASFATGQTFTVDGGQTTR